MAMIIGMTIEALTEEQRAFLRSMVDDALASGDGQPPALPPAPPVTGGVGPFFDSAPGFVQEVIRRHWPESTWERAAHIAYLESGYRPEAHNTNGEDSRGLWQINVVPAANPDLLALGDLFNPDVNAQAAVQVWQRQGWVAWLNTATMAGIPLTGAGIP